MTFMFAFPFLGGVLVFIFLSFAKTAQPSRVSFNLYNSGIATITAGSFLKGIFEIAGTSSPFECVFFIAGIAFIIASIILHAIK